jgi:hypothetical protein
MLFGQRRPGAIDIGAGARVGAIEEQDARPEMNGVFKPSVEVPIESVFEEEVHLLVARSGLTVARGAAGGCVRAASGVCHFV